MKIKILVQSPFASDANSFWRCMGPMSYLAKQSQGQIELHVYENGHSLSWSSLDRFDLVFMHRPCRPDDLVVLQLARNMNVPVWVDYDDWLFHIPEWNPNRHSYHLPGIQNIMATMLACADVVTCSTQALYETFKELNANTIIVPNAYRSDLFKYRSKQPFDRKPIFSWRGTNTHEGDLLSVGGAFNQLSAPIHFLGSPAYSLISQMDANKYKIVSMADPILYWKNIYDLAPKVLLFPLFDDFFNHCKSNIAWIEAIHAGAIVVAPENMNEWKQPGVVGYRPHDIESFLAAAEFAMGLSNDEVKKINADAFEYILAKYDISVINQIRLSIIDTLLSKTFDRNTRNPYDQLTGIWALSVLKNEPLPRVKDEMQRV